MSDRIRRVTRLTCDQTQDLLGAFVLDSLDPRQEIEVRSHLESCAACRDEAEELRAAAMSIGEAVEPVAPPAQLREQIMREIRQPRLERVVVPLEPARAWWARPRAAWSVAALAAVLMLAAGGWGLSEHLSAQGLRSPGTLVATALNPVDRLIASGQAQVVPLTPTSGTVARAAVVTDPVTGVTYLLLLGVPVLHSDQAYTLWYMSLHEGSLKAIAVGDMTRPGAYRMPRSPKGFLKIAITKEPAPHDSVPRGPVLMEATLA